MKCRLLRDLKGDRTPENPDGLLPTGTLIDHRDAYLLVRLGVAEPADEECRQRAGMSKEMMARAQYVYERADRGIVPEDFELYDSGKIVGYNPDGSYIPGPNADQDMEESPASQLWIPEEYWNDQ